MNANLIPQKAASGNDGHASAAAIYDGVRTSRVEDVCVICVENDRDIAV
jgi:hypothetical protein